MIKLGPREVESNQIDMIVAYIFECFESQRTNMSCYVYGMGGQPKNVYSQIALTKDVSLKLTYSSLSKFLFFLRFIPSYAGVVQILDPLRLKQVFEQLGDSTLAGICFLKSDYDKEFLELFLKGPLPNAVDQWFDKAESGIFYQLDSSNGSSKTGMYDWIKIGESLSQSIISDTHQLWVKE